MTSFATIWYSRKARDDNTHQETSQIRAHAHRRGADARSRRELGASVASGDTACDHRCVALCAFASGSAFTTAPRSSRAGCAAACRAAYGFEEYVVHRVMQRVDVVLDQRLREAIAVVVQEQTRSMVPRLREEVESVVRQAVYEAVAEELAGERSGH